MAVWWLSDCGWDRSYLALPLRWLLSLAFCFSDRYGVDVLSTSKDQKSFVFMAVYRGEYAVAGCSRFAVNRHGGCFSCTTPRVGFCIKSLCGCLVLKHMYHLLLIPRRKVRPFFSSAF